MFQSGNSTVTVNFVNPAPAIQSAFGCGNVQEESIPAGEEPLVGAINLPDGSSYQLTYEPTPGNSSATTGRLASLKVPTGATISYSYPGANDGINCLDGTNLSLNRATSDGTWTYRRTVSGSSGTTTVTDPQSNQIVVSFQNSRETQRQIYQGSSTNGTLLQTIITCYNGTKSNCNTTPVSLPVTEVSRFVLLPNGKENEVDSFFASNAALPTEVDEYDFGANQPGALLRKTLISYASLGNNIVDRPLKVTICSPGGTDSDCGSSGTKVSQTTFGYDETTPTATSGITQHVAVSGSRGNQTSSHRWLNTTNSTLDTVNTFDDTGNVLTTTDPGGHKTSFSFTNGCNGALVTQTTLPDTNSPNLTHHQTSATYDCNTGLQSTSTDQNGNETKFFYDNMFRPTEVDYSNGGQTLTSYPSVTQSIVQNKIDGSRSTYSTTLRDGYGRVSRTAAKSDESTPYDQQDVCYDSDGRLGFKSYPYQGQGFSTGQVCSGAGDSFTYDALGRPTKVIHSDGSASSTSYTGSAAQITDEGNGSSSVSRILQKDALGRLTGVCEVYGGNALLGSGGVPASCSLDIAGSGFLTSYTYDLLGNLNTVTQGSLASRTYSYDSLSRMTSESTPEAGAVSYSYNPDSLLTQRTRPSPNQTSASVKTTTNYAYDPLHRLTGRTYTNDPANTPAATFNYDEGSLWGSTLANTIGRSSSESVSGASPAEQIFSYDSVGRPILNAQCTPNTCNANPFVPYSLGYQYDLLGDTTSAGNGVGVTFNYSYNIAGRLTQMTSSMIDANHPDVLFGAAHYSPTSTTDILGNSVAETTSFSSRGLLQSQQALLPQTGGVATGSVTVAGSLESSPTGSVVNAVARTPFTQPAGGTGTVYLGADGNVWFFWNSTSNSATTSGWHNSSLSGIAGAAAAASATQLYSYIDGSNNQDVFYVGTDGHVHQLWWNGDPWKTADLTTATGGANAVAGTLFTRPNGGTGMVYVGTDGNVWFLWNSSGNTATTSAWHSASLSGIAGAPAAASATQLYSYLDGSNNQVVLYVGTDGHVHELWWNGDPWKTADLTALTGGPNAVAGTAFTRPNGGTGIAYLGTDGNVWYFWNSTNNSATTSGWHNASLTGIAGAPTAASTTELYSFLDGSSNQNVLYVGTDGHVHQLWWNGDPWKTADLSVNSATTFDSGVTSLELGSFTASACFGSSSNSACTGQPANTTTTQLASALAQAINVSSSPATAAVSGSTINLTWKTAGPEVTAVSALSTTHDQPNLFPAPSFTSPATILDVPSSTTSAYSYALGLAPDGQITSANDLVNGNWIFGYDPFNRLVSSNKNSGQQTFTYEYDRTGNRWHQNAPQGGPAPQYIFDNNNHLTDAGVTYDALGEELTDGLGNSFTWDAEGRLIQVNQGSTVTATYSYDAEGRRVHGPNGEYVYDLNGRMITQVGLNGVWNYGEIYAEGSHLATYSSGTTNFFHSDWLGTKRIMTALNGTISQTCTGFAFGDGVSCTGTNFSFNGFTDDIHDSETNLEHTLFRKYSGTQGRWLTPDPMGTGSADPMNPQSWNRYAYVMNDPVNGADPTGLFDLWGSGFGGFGLCSFEDAGCDLGSFYPWGLGQLNLPVAGVPLNLGILPGETSGIPDWVPWSPGPTLNCIPDLGFCSPPAGTLISAPGVNPNTLSTLTQRYCFAPGLSWDLSFNCMLGIVQQIKSGPPGFTIKRDVSEFLPGGSNKQGADQLAATARVINNPCTYAVWTLAAGGVGALPFTPQIYGFVADNAADWLAAGQQFARNAWWRYKVYGPRAPGWMGAAAVTGASMWRACEAGDF